MKLSPKILLTALAISSASLSTAYASNASPNTNMNSDRALTRAEVQADLAIWNRAGLGELHRGELTPDTFSAEYKAAYAEYIRMRNGPEHQEELKKRQN
ncbi:DUF4148 domain-containing protein [Alcaligenes phenolicus]|uniref:DUF4148 domain-containing protein n=1 Tax=Alcaligenes phenolicus TaxID=232846 RepID=A0AAW5VQR7_9BURK|nr:DUF4148 domain-containing protein [Alcaligenes phenolicus]MCX5563750.1 DUF4148 domain-containing protein [Alcaligenes phenolicus]